MDDGKKNQVLLAIVGFNLALMIGVFAMYMSGTESTMLIYAAGIVGGIVGGALGYFAGGMMG